MSTTRAPQIFDLVSFCKTAPHCFPHWDDELISGYLTFHLQQGSLKWVGDSLGQIVAMGVAWRLPECVLLNPRFRATPWRWRFDQPFGDVLYVDNLIAHRTSAIGCLVSEIQWLYPNWRAMKFAALRRGHVKWYHPEKILNRLEAL